MADAIRQIGVSEVTYYRWRQEFGGLKTEQVKRPDPVVSCFFGRIAPSDAATESCFSIRGNRENEIASFQGLRHGNFAISSQQSRQKTTLAQWVRSSSRATSQSSGD
jgi:hypothetical protein